MTHHICSMRDVPCPRSSSLGRLSLCQVCIVVSPSCPLFLPPLFIPHASFFLASIWASASRPAWHCWTQEWYRKAGGEMYFAGWTHETWGTDTLVQSGSLVAKTGGITWLHVLMTCGGIMTSWRWLRNKRILPESLRFAESLISYNVGADQAED